MLAGVMPADSVPSLLPPSAMRPLLVLDGPVAVASGRVHEICGPARRTFAAMLAARTTGEVVWIVPAHDSAMLCPQGLGGFLCPGRVLLVRPRRPVDALWAAEEALRTAGAVLGAVVVECAEPPMLTPVRRLQLAAERGGGQAPCLVLTPEDGGAAGAESRWHAASLPSGGWRIERRRARMAPPAAFVLGWGARGATVCPLDTPG
jgi:protein ImuA